ncbi:unnamed protein product [Cyberlindnera jadinii]|uniref:U3 small nucleolar ribonucleoprotein protein MPP10 n=1 Tax=Cyberlindnera jadinii (strain ATCC 18201 / CBS 1600 / BCRC 20928 / JCM 3617 / NBRC 0987 / NRRL Y-1542) TaxID=983966 RepID=A0A0H5C978_CYBJN|nr:unnamed protein product [Cyberlindnera jadinii]
MSLIEKLTSDPTQLLDSSVESSEFLALVKGIIDPITKGHSVLDEIYIDGLDASQVWQQAKIILDNVTEELLFDKLPSLKGAVSVKGGSEDKGDSDDGSDDGSEDGSGSEEVGEESDDEAQHAEFDGEDDYEEESISEGEKNSAEASTAKGEPVEDKKDVFGLNDGFFSIDDFNKQILDQEREQGGDLNDEDDVDYFGDIPDSDDDEVAYYDDFFAKPKELKTDFKKAGSKKNKKAKQTEEEPELNEDDFEDGMKSAMLDLFDDKDVVQEEEHQEEKNLSSFERQQLAIQQEIAKLENEAIAEKKWAMKGETKAKDRPTDSLLDEDLEFERTAKPVPVITKDVTESLEEMIRRRIKEGNFDDLPRRIISDVTNFKPSSSFQLSEEKSSKSLAELYENEYKQEQDGEISEELQRAHDEVKDLFASISYKLDALSSAHFIPKPAQKSIDIKVNAPTISMEDAQPLTQSTGSTLAPQEIYNATRSGDGNEIQLKSGTVFSRDELTREDKQRMRRANKRKRSKEFKEREQNPVKKSKKQQVIETLSKAKNVTVIDSKGQRRDVEGNVKKDKVQQGTSSLKL